MRTLIFFPPLSWVSGGMAVLIDTALYLLESGHDVSLVTLEPFPGLDKLAPGVPVVAWRALNLRQSDVWLVPEGWSNSLAPGLKAGARCISYVQNWAFVHGQLPQGVHWEQLKVDFLAVSHPVAWFMAQTTGILPPIVRPGIERKRFYSPERDATEPPRGPVRIAWMPRKNKAMASQTRAIFEARLDRRGETPEWVEIHGKQPDEVADTLRTCHIFLATGFPEGLGLPPLEAMACGCLVAGFAGFGGWDYLRQALPEGAPGRFTPWWPQRPDSECPWNGNAFVTADADTLAAALALEQAVNVLRDGGAPLAHLRNQGQLTANAYSREHHKEAVLTFWKSLETA